MEKVQYKLIEDYMLSCMKDSAHDEQHIYRVLYNAMDIAKTEKCVDYDILIGACLLHDIARGEQFKDPKVCHAMLGGEKAYQFLIKQGFDAIYAQAVKQCIQTHRYRKNNQPKSIESKILFDADKLDTAGAMGIARTLVYIGNVSEPLYAILPNGEVSDGSVDEEPSFFQEYKYKLENLYSRFYTERGRQLALDRRAAAVSFYNDMYKEVNSSHRNGRNELNKVIS